jgi:peptide chain release factor 2
VREREEIQVVPWRSLTPVRPRHPGTSRRAGGGPKGRLAEAERYLGLDRLQARRAELEAEAADPDLWNDGDHARAVTTELGSGNGRSRAADRTGQRAERRHGLVELVDESRADGAHRTASFEKELVETVDGLRARLGALELQSLFSGEYDERDAVVDLHAGAGGTDAQDWTEMMLRMYQRWAERRGFTVEFDEETEGQEAGLLSATFIVHGRFAYGLLATERGVHRLVRMSPFDSQKRRPDQLRLIGRHAVSRGRLERGRDRREGPAHRHLPLVGRRWPAREQDGLGRAPHPPADGFGGVVPERAQPAPEQGQGDADPRGQVGGAGPQERKAEMNALSGDRGDNAWGNQIRSYVHGALSTGEGSADVYETGNVAAVLDGDLDAFMEAELRRQRGSTSG